MKNRVTEVFSSMSDMDLMKALVEMREDEPKGVFRQDGVVRDICQKIHDIIFLLIVWMLSFLKMI
jgi:hypothetical protein